MLHFNRWKTFLILLPCLAGMLLAAPSMLSTEMLAKLPSWWPKQQIALGLDLKGGAHILLEIDAADLRNQTVETVRDDVRRKLTEAKVPTSSLQSVGGKIVVRFEKAEDAEKGYRELRTLIQPVGGLIIGATRGNNIEVVREDPTTVSVTPTEAGLRERVVRGIDAAIETLRRRIDPGGNKETTIVRQGDQRILVQVPGVEDTKPIIALIGTTAKLTFRLVHPTLTPETMPGGRPPAGYEVVQADDKERRSAGGQPSYLLERRSMVTGEDLSNAIPGFDQQNGQPVVNFNLYTSGARAFGKVTSANVGRPFAIVLDDKVISAPVIRSAITGGSGQISGSFSVAEAARLAVLLKSGALPAKLTVVEERTVGASLGQDSIQAGKIAALIGTIAVIAFMLFAYGLFGIFAVLAVAINIAMIVALMALFGSTLTLPGIAGIVLTVGMAVDANVLIYERIREELRNGKTSIAAIEAGFTRALATIIDANLTTLIAGILMFWLGSGPVRGFAVTLSLGILTTVFTAFTVTRLLVSWWLAAQSGKKVPAPL